jgi:hypothetical protein
MAKGPVGRDAFSVSGSSGDPSQVFTPNDSLPRRAYRAGYERHLAGPSAGRVTSTTAPRASSSRTGETLLSRQEAFSASVSSLAAVASGARPSHRRAMPSELPVRATLKRTNGFASANLPAVSETTWRNSGDPWILIDPLSGAEDAQAAKALPRANRAMPLRSNELALLLITFMGFATGRSER